MPTQFPEPKPSITPALVLWAVTTFIITALFTVPAGLVQDLAPQAVASTLGTQFCAPTTTPEIRAMREHRNTSYTLACVNSTGRAETFHNNDFTLAYMGLWTIPAALLSVFITWWFMRSSTARLEAELQLA